MSEQLGDRPPTDDERRYFARREADERRAAKLAVCAATSKIHRALAESYRARIAVSRGPDAH